MNKVLKEDLKKIQMEILNVTSTFCEENNIKYWIDGGTLLGAIRHNGYIPWDDDIDIGMLREDFEHFIHEFNDYNSRYTVKCFENDKSFYYAYAKVLDTRTILYEPDENGNKININIDIFVYDNAPDDEKQVKKTFNRRDIYRDANQLRTLRNKPSGEIGRRFFINFMRYVLQLFPRDFFVRMELKNAQKYNEKETRRVGNFLGWARFTCDKHALDSTIDHIFEGKMYKIPVGYDEWLKNFYGDYMKLPPIEQQVSHHKFIAYIED